MWWNKKRIYLDYAGATPLSRTVIRAMKPYLSTDFGYGNASSIHTKGREAKEAIEDARLKIARSLSIKVDEVIFTGSGTESNNLALRGSVNAMLNAGVVVSDIEIISTKVEHPSIIKTLDYLAGLGVRVNYLPVNDKGLVSVQELEKQLSPKTRIVSFGYANSETGVVQEIGKIGKFLKNWQEKRNIKLYFHTDASQAPLWLNCSPDSLGVDLMTLDSGKCRGPKGVGILIRRANTKISAIYYGGNQEDNLRPGTENTMGIVGAAVALTEAQSGYKQLSQTTASVRDYFVDQLLKIPRVELNGSKKDRLANNVNVSFLGVNTEYLVVLLDNNGIEASTKSACSTKDGGYSKVIYEMTRDMDRANSTMRFSLTPETTKRDIDYVISIIRENLNLARA